MLGLFNPRYELMRILYPAVNSMCKVDHCTACEKKTRELMEEVYVWHKKYKDQDVSPYFQDSSIIKQIEEVILT